ncbi:hypothetical protein [uncultured Dokdonia sp.]|uniref:hypothetical protein n=1 Tax=uncultured Dokdonia sp. TaxID=575653 RepID=UPI0026327589|nr:hypothetical protein [uncultured Dokdonia sp.]
MSSTIKYVQIFNLNIFHNYFLDTKEKDIDGNEILVVFDDTQKTGDLVNYNVADFLHIAPSQDTNRILANHKIAFKKTTDGATCFISVDQDSKPMIDSTGVTIDLLIYSNDTLFEKYTDINTSPEDLYFFTNDTTVPVANRINILSDVATSLDNYTITASVDLMNKYQALSESLTGSEKRSLLGVVSIKLDEIIENGQAVGDVTEFKIVLKNRKTIWQYLNDDGSIYAQTGTPQPFMRRGNIIPRDQDDAIIPYRMATPFDAFKYPEASDVDQSVKTQIYI